MVLFTFAHHLGIKEDIFYCLLLPLISYCDWDCDGWQFVHPVENFCYVFADCFFSLLDLIYHICNFVIFSELL